MTRYLLRLPGRMARAALDVLLHDLDEALQVSAAETYLIHYGEALAASRTAKECPA